MKKPLMWQGSALHDLKDDAVFTVEARKYAGQQLNAIQAGCDPEDWKPFDIVGAGTKEIRININGQFRVMYVAKFPEAIYVLHCFRKKTQETSKRDKDLAAARYKELVRKRSTKP